MNLNLNSSKMVKHLVLLVLLAFDTVSSLNDELTSSSSAWIRHTRTNSPNTKSWRNNFRKPGSLSSGQHPQIRSNIENKDQLMLPFGRDIICLCILSETSA